MLTRLLRLLRLPCGHFGGQSGTYPDLRTRWCHKHFGHEDSHAYEVGEQPLDALRRQAQGWD